MAPVPQHGRDRQQAGGQAKVIGSKRDEKNPHSLSLIRPVSDDRRGPTLTPGLTCDKGLSARPSRDLRVVAGVDARDPRR